VIRTQYFVKGQVQGVGFRPFVYRLAWENGLSGFVKNDLVEPEKIFPFDESFLKSTQRGVFANFSYFLTMSKLLSHGKTLNLY